VRDRIWRSRGASFTTVSAKTFLVLSLLAAGLRVGSGELTEFDSPRILLMGVLVVLDGDDIPSVGRRVATVNGEFSSTTSIFDRDGLDWDVRGC